MVIDMLAMVGGGVLELDSPPPPQAARLLVRPVTSALVSARRNILRCIAKIPLELFRCAGRPAVLAIAGELDVG